MSEFVPPSASEARAQASFNALKRQNERFVIDANGDDSKLPTWIVHFPDGTQLPIESIDLIGNLLRFVGRGSDATGYAYAVVAPESLMLTIQWSEPSNDEPTRKPIGFGPHAT